jgi:hypothetical protein
MPCPNAMLGAVVSLNHSHRAQLVTLPFALAPNKFKNAGRMPALQSLRSRRRCGNGMIPPSLCGGHGMPCPY